ncbi:4-aminobutyrate--pyruvate transaminase [Rhodoligotrophos appendicifer]|uniref:aminotransferase n=1 Tax=Rhodoligotrophos appendicifer TaxID=987056 RepID=UPI00117C294F|nr:aminotransferase [Rhodoligotrophos appendicifer]
MNKLSNLSVRDVETLIHPYTNLATHRDVGPLVIERGKGIYVYDAEGREYIEGLAGLWCTALGYSNEELVEAAAKQMRTMPYTHIFAGKSHDPAIELAEKLKELAPHNASKVLFCSSGSEANDQQVKLAWYHANAIGKPEKKKIISRIRGYHGVTVASGSLTGLAPVHMDFDLPIKNILHTECPHYYRNAHEGESEADFSSRMAASLEAMIEREGPETVAAFIAEPIMGAGGVVVPPEGYFEKIQAICKKYDIRFIADEVICGFGRTGNYWGSETFGITPNSISVAKAITSAYLPLGAITIEEDVYQAMLDESRKIGTFGHGYTYTGHPVAAAVALKTLEIYERTKIIDHVKKLAPVFEGRFNKLIDREIVGEVRAKGMIGAVELVSDKRTKKPFDPKAGVGAKTIGFMQANGLIGRAVAGDSIALCPPLIITEGEINEMFDRLETSLDQTQAWISKEGVKAAA